MALTQKERETEEAEEPPSVYLAGPVMSPDDNGHGWREWIEARYPDIDWVNPLDKYDAAADEVEIVTTEEKAEMTAEQREEAGELVTCAEIVEDDKAMIDSCDAVLVGWTRVPSVGTPMEVLYAFEADIPVAVWYEPEGSREPLTGKTLSPWLQYHAGIVAQAPKPCIDFIQL